MTFSALPISGAPYPTQQFPPKPFESNAIKSTKQVAQKVFSSRITLSEASQSFWNSRIVRSFIFTAIVTLTTAYVCTPLGWATAVAGLAAFIVALIVSAVTQKGQFELSAISRALSKKSFDEIVIPPSFRTSHNLSIGPNSPKIFLGSLPNKFTNDLEKLQEQGVGAVLSINEAFEHEPIGISFPPQKSDYANAHIEYHELYAKDHEQLPQSVLEEATDFIHEQLMQGRNVYVHCRAGKGRSSAPIAALLVKLGMTVPAACHQITNCRSVATTWNKIPALLEYKYRLEIRKAVSKDLLTQLNLPVNAAAIAAYNHDNPETLPQVIENTLSQHKDTLLQNKHIRAKVSLILENTYKMDSTWRGAGDGQLQNYVEAVNRELSRNLLDFLDSPIESAVRTALISDVNLNEDAISEVIQQNLAAERDNTTKNAKTSLLNDGTITAVINAIKSVQVQEPGAVAITQKHYAKDKKGAKALTKQLRQARLEPNDTSRNLSAHETSVSWSSNALVDPDQDNETELFKEPALDDGYSLDSSVYIAFDRDDEH